MMQPTDHDTLVIRPIEDDGETIALFGDDTPDHSLGATEPSTASRYVDAPPQRQEESDDVVMRYFGDVRNFSLLDREQERAMWQRIEKLKNRRHRMLLMSPVALPVLTRVWNQIKHGELALSQVMEIDADDDSGWQEDAFGNAVAAWPSLDAPRRVRRQRYREWVTSWSSLKCKDSLYDMLQEELQSAYEQHPGDMGLSSAWWAWSRTQWHFEQAKTRMLQANLRLAVYIAQAYRNSGLPLLDLVQEGNIGLMRAIEKFEPQRGVKFVTYAYWWIRQAIGRGIIQQGRTIRLPSHTIERHNKMMATARRFKQAHGKAANPEELGSAMGCTPKDIEDLRTVTQSVVPLQQMAGEDGRALAEVLPADQERAPDAMLTHAEMKQCIVNCLETLSPREAFILRQRFGFDSEPQSLREIGESLGLSRERVRQIEKSALERLRESPHHDALMDFMF